jgi:probable HAF family extracellular repeat protein
MTRRVGFLAVVLALVLVAAACRVVPDPMEDIGTLGSSVATAQGVNDRGVIVGASAATDPAGQDIEAFFYEPTTGEMTGLGVLQPGSPSTAMDVNNHDLAVGNAHFWAPTQIQLSHAVAWPAGGALTDFNDQLGFWHESAAVAVNDDNVVVGWAHRFFDLGFPVVIATLDFAYDLDTGVMTPLPIGATDINDNGLVVGGRGGHAATYDLATGVVTELPTLGGTSAHANAVNDHGVVVGQSETTGGQFHAFSYNPDTGVVTDLGTMGTNYSEAFGVNDAGHVVGRANAGDAQAFFYLPLNGSMTDLGTLPGGSFTIAHDINNRDLVVGDTTVLGYTRAWQTTVRFEPH